MSKIIKFNTEARSKLKKGIDILANSVKVTLGPMGRNVILEQPYGPPRVTKDGVSVAKEVDLSDPFENAGAQLIKSTASKTCDDVGDGTSTSSVLTQAIISEGIKNLEAGANPVDLNKGINIAVKAVVNYIKTHSIKVEDDLNKIKQVATVSANNDPEIGELIASAFEQVSKDGVITIESSSNADTTISIVEGLQLDRGYASPYFATNTETAECVLENPYILLYDGKINNVKDMIHILESVLNSTKPLLIIANDIDSEALSTLVINKIKNNFKLCMIKSPGFGESQTEYLKDTAAITGGRVISEAYTDGLKGSSIQDLGSAEKVIITRDTTTIVNGNSNKEELEKRINSIKESLKHDDSANTRNRLARISGGVAILYVGANSEMEMNEKKDRVEDALCATRAAIEEGIVPGGGTAYIEARKELALIKNEYSGDIATGINIIMNAITIPLYTIAENAGINGGIVVNEVMKLSDGFMGYNAKTNAYVNMLNAGIVDPAKVSRVALENAASVASLVLTTGCVICNNDKNEQASLGV